MNEEVKIEFRDDHVLVQLGSGYKFGPADSDEVWKRIRSLCDVHHTCRVLVEGLVPAGERNAADIVAAGERTAAVPNLWMALHLADFVPTEQSELFKVIAATRGVRVKFFADRDDALQWLRSNAPS